MYAAIPTPIRELSTLASNPEGCLKDFMNHFVELTSAHQWFQRCSRDPSREHNTESFGSGKWASSTALLTVGARYLPSS